MIPKSAWELSGVVWGHDLAIALTQLNVRSLDDTVALGNATRDVKDLVFGKKLKSALRDIWKHAPVDVFDNAWAGAFPCIYLILIFTWQYSRRTTKGR